MICNHTDLTSFPNKFVCHNCGKKWYRVTPGIYESYDRHIAGEYKETLRMVNGKLTDVVGRQWARVVNEPGRWRDTLADMAERIEEFGRGSRQRALKFNPSFRPGDIVDVMDDDGEYQFGGRVVSKLPGERYLLISGRVVREVDLRQHQVEFFGRGLAVNPGDPRAIKFQREHVPAVKLDDGTIVVGKKLDLHGNIISRLPKTQSPYVVDTGWVNIGNKRWVSRKEAEELCGKRECVNIEAAAKGVREVDWSERHPDIVEYGKKWEKIYNRMKSNPHFQPNDLFFFDAELDFLVRFGLVIPRQPGTLFETDHGIFRLREYSEEYVGWYVDQVKAKQGSTTSWAGVPREILDKVVPARRLNQGRRHAVGHSAKKSLAARLWNIEHKEEYNKRMREYMRDYRKRRFRS
jgi:hypothetical protein